MSVKVKRIRDLIVEVSGKHDYTINEIVQFPSGQKGIVMKATEDMALISLFDLGSKNPILVGDSIKLSGEEFKFNFNESSLGNVINVLGENLTHHENAENKSKTMNLPIFATARPIYTRDFVDEPLKTGLSSVDWAIPIGKGQRELILGDRETGKTAIAVNAILAQKETEVKIVYVAVGQKRTSVLAIYNKLMAEGLQDRFIIVAATADQSATKKWLAPYVGVTIAEHFQEKYGDDVLIIYDDLSKHADAYRELSLLMKSAPAREAYPGDIFYLHSKLLERAGKFIKQYGGGSITALPIVQTEAGDITSYIPTNVISITDGQVFTNKQLFNAGHRPAIDVSYSVSRVGSTAQTSALAAVSGGLKLLVSQYNEAKKMARLSSASAAENEDVLKKGKVLMALLVQPEYDVIDYDTGVVLLSLFKMGYLDFFSQVDEISLVKTVINNYLTKNFLGKRLRKIIMSKEINKVQYELYIREIILPLIKYFLVTKYPYLRKEEAFIDKFKDIRDDGRVYKNLSRIMELGEING